MVVRSGTVLLLPVYTIQPVVKPVVRQVWQPGKCLYTRYNRLSTPLSNRLSNRFNNRLYRVYRHSTGCQTCLTTALTNGCIVYTDGCQTGFDNQLNEQWLFVQHGCQTGRQTRLTTGLTTGWMFVYTIQPVVKPVVQPVWQPVVSCKRGITVKFCLALCNR